MPINQELSKVLKEIWRIDEKLMAEEIVSPEEVEFYKKHLPTIKNYYHEQYLYWEKK